VDNGSSDGTAEAAQREFPSVLLIRSRCDIGTAARNIAVAYVHTPYVAFCDEDTQWLPGSLERAADVMDAYPEVAVVNGCVLTGESGSIHPLCHDMAQSPLDRENLPGPQLLSFMAGASVVRAKAFYEVGGFWPPLFAGGEESLLALDLADRGWRIVYMEDVVQHRYPMRGRNTLGLELRAMRNAIWVAWMRLPAEAAWRETVSLLSRAAKRRQLRPVVMLTLTGIGRALRERHVITPRVAHMRDMLVRHTMRDESRGTASSGRRSMA